MTYMRNRDGQKGFTIVEILVVISVIAILASITVVSYNAVRKNSELQTAMTDAQTVAVRLNRYKADNGEYPTPAIFSASSDMTQSTKSTITYTRNAGNDTFCVGAINNGGAAYATSVNTTAVEGSCP